MCEVPNISTLLEVTLNDTFRPTESLMRNIPEGLTVCSLTKAAARMPSVVERYLNTLAADSTPQAALNTLLFQDGVFVYAAKGVSSGTPRAACKYLQCSGCRLWLHDACWWWLNRVLR